MTQMVHRVTGLKLRVNASGGSVSPLTEVGGGLYAFDYLPGIVTTPTTAQISVKGKTADRANLTTCLFTCTSTAVGGIRWSQIPARLCWVKTRMQHFHLPWKARWARWRCSVDLRSISVPQEGDNLTHLGKGRFTARFVAPKVNYPQLSILTVADRLQSVGCIWSAYHCLWCGQDRLSRACGPRSDHHFEDCR